MDAVQVGIAAIAKYARSAARKCSEEWVQHYRTIGTEPGELGHFFGLQAGFALICHSVVSDRLGLADNAKLHQYVRPSEAHGFFADAWQSTPAKELTEATRQLRCDLLNSARRADAFSHLYQRLFPRKVRRAMGEFHTPCDLARWIILESGYASDVNEIRFCDPSCGNGSFIEEAINRCVAVGVGVERITSCVAGLEMNPASLMASWAVYALCSPPTPGQPLEIPVFLLDSLNLDATDSLQRIARFLPFDFVIGNPAWINWGDIPETMRTNIGGMVHRYGLKEGRATVGAVKIDLSGLSLLVAANRLLAPGGTLAFLITQAALKANAMSGFRRFRLPDGTRLRPLVAHDFSKVQLFAGASNRTACLVLRKGEGPKYPVRTLHWMTANGERNATIAGLVSRTSASFPMGASETSPWVSVPKHLVGTLRRFLGGPCPYRPRLGINTAGGTEVFWGKVSGGSDGDNVMFQSGVLGRPVPIEKALLYPFVKGKAVRRWARVRPELAILVAHTAESGMRAIDADRLETDYPNTSRYLHHPDVRSVLSGRRALLRWGGRGGFAWYSLFEIGKYTFEPFKVAYRGQIASRFEATVIASYTDETLGAKLVIPDQTVHFIPCPSQDEALYLCALLNSCYVRLLYRCLNYKHPGTFFVRSLRLPRFAKDSPLHAELAAAATAISTEAQKRNEHAQHRCDEVITELYQIEPSMLNAVSRAVTSW